MQKNVIYVSEIDILECGWYGIFHLFVVLISKGAISLELQSEMKIFPGKRVDGNEDRREVRLGNVAMLLNIYCEIHELCSMYWNKICLNNTQN